MTTFRCNTGYLEWPTKGEAKPSPASDWPINEVLLQSLEAQGFSDAQIAVRYDVAWQQVVALRESIG